MYQKLFSVAAIALTFIIYLPYLRSIRRGDTRPHVFSWVIWGLTILLVFFAQLAAHGGAGTWPVGVTGSLTVYIAILAYRQRADTHITRTDWLFFAAALSALPCWFFTSNPLWAVVTLTLVDLAAFGPTFRRGYVQPHSENATFFALFVLRNALVIAALERRSLTTVLFPAADALACLLLVCTLMYRRRRGVPAGCKA